MNSQDVFEAGWQPLDRLFGTTEPELAFGLRETHDSGATDPDSLNTSIQRAKLIDLGLSLGDRTVVLWVTIAPEKSGTVGVLVRLHPNRGEVYLPPQVRLVMLAASGEALQVVQARSQDNYIQLRRFTGQAGDRFKIQVVLGDVSLTEDFVL